MQDAPAFHRNKEPMLGVLRNLLAGNDKNILEIASGSGQHGPYFTNALPNLTWWPTDINPAALASIQAWTEHLAATSVKPPQQLDVTGQAWRNGGGFADWPVAFDGILSMNMIHIAPYEATTGLIEGAAKHLLKTGKLMLYGPFKRQNKHTSPSNEAFDQSLQSRDPSWGIRNLEDIIEIAEDNNLTHHQTIEMPANNLVVVFER